MRVLIAGCGYVGTALGVRLARGGHRVWGLRRNPKGLPSAIRGVAADLGAMASIPDFFRLVDHVVYAAAPDVSTPHAYGATYVEGVRNLVRALRSSRAPVRRFVFVSSTAVWGQSHGEWVDESTPPSPDDFRGAILREAEECVLSAPFPGVILRLGGIYGPGRTRLIERVRPGDARCPEGDPTWSNRIHRDDAAAILEHLLTVPSPDSVYVGVDDEPAPLCDVYRHVADLLGVAPPTPDPSVSPRRSNKRCSNRRLKETGYRFLFPSYREGYSAVIEGTG
jgi:nucleoside-diphosphate-sugar epimerase